MRRLFCQGSLHYFGISEGNPPDTKALGKILKGGLVQGKNSSWTGRGSVLKYFKGGGEGVFEQFISNDFIIDLDSGLMKLVSDL